MRDLLARISGLADWLDSRSANIFLKRRVLETEGKWDVEQGKALAFKSVAKTLRDMVTGYQRVLETEVGDG